MPLVFDSPVLKPLAAQLAPVRAFFETQPVYLLAALVAIGVTPLAVLLSRGGKKKVGDSRVVNAKSGVTQALPGGQVCGSSVALRAAPTLLWKRESNTMNRLRHGPRRCLGACSFRWTIR